MVLIEVLMSDEQIKLKMVKKGESLIEKFTKANAFCPGKNDSKNVMDYLDEVESCFQKNENYQSTEIPNLIATYRETDKFVNGCQILSAVIDEIKLL